MLQHQHHSLEVSNTRSPTSRNHHKDGACAIHGVLGHTLWDSSAVCFFRRGQIAFLAFMEPTGRRHESWALVDSC